MSKRSVSHSVLLIGAALALASCSKADWREGVEKPEDCIVRMSEQAGDLFTQPAAQLARWIPTFTFDIAKMDQAAVDELIASTDARVVDNAVGTISAGVGTLNFPPGVDLPMNGAAVLRLGDDELRFRLRDRPVAIANAFAAGCAIQRPGMRLIDVHLEPPPKEGPGAQASALSGSTLSIADWQPSSAPAR